jgi:hypothetical protein
MASARRAPGPWTHRLLVYFFTVLFAVLVHWLLGFVMRDIGSWPGPDYQEVQQGFIDPGLMAELASVRSRIEETNRAIVSRKQRQSVLRDSTSNSERTMNQLLELQKLTLQKGLTPSPEEVKALAESQRLFLANQVNYQEMNDQIAALTEQLDGLQALERELQNRVAAQSPAVQAEFNRQLWSRQWKVAAVKLAVLAPLLAAAGWMFLKKRGGLYAPLIYGFGLALAVRVGMVMHEHFPRRYFKYILLAVALLVVARILIYLLRTMAFPKLDWLLRQYREAYEHFLCPICAYPIRRGALKYLFWNRRTVKKLPALPAAETAPEEPYVCPVCSTRLFEPCERCKAIRHSLLPACNHCGAEKDIEPVLIGANGGNRGFPR